MRDKLQRELRIYMQILPLSEKEVLHATQAVNVAGGSESIKRLIEAASVYRAHVEIINLIIRVLGETE